MEVAVFDHTGKETGRTVVLSDAIFGVTPNEHAVYLDVKQYLANQRQGTHKSKERSEMSGSTRKLHKQKGTGGSRKGDINAPQFRGGARVFGPRPRDYSFKINKKVKSVARRSVLSSKAATTAITVLAADFALQAPKTKDYIKFLQGFGALDKKTLLVLPDKNDNVVLSSRNLQKAKVTTANLINTYELLHADTIIISESSLPIIEELLK